ncbi:MAG: Clp protease N-terminal domain-containing protein [Candidatus Dormiibacterota bacterium]
MAKATTVRFTDEIFARLDQASARTGMPVNSIVIAACLEWMQRHTPVPSQPAMGVELPSTEGLPFGVPPRWATIQRAVVEAVAGRTQPLYPFARFTNAAQNMLTAANAEAKKSGFRYIGTEHLLLGAFADATSHSALILASLGVREDTVRSALERMLHTKEPTANPRIIPTSRVKKVIELAFKLCGAAGDPRVGTGHILLALASEGQGIAAHALKDAGATADRIQAAMEITEPEP